MIRTTIRRGGLLVATTALAATAFAGSAAAGQGEHHDPYKHHRGSKNKISTEVTGAGGPGGNSGVSQDNCTAIYNAPLVNAPVLTDLTGVSLFEQSFDATQCNVGGTGDASGGDGIEAE